MSSGFKIGPAPGGKPPGPGGPGHAGPKLSLRMAVALALAGWMGGRPETRVTPLMFVAAFVLSPLAILTAPKVIVTLGLCVSVVVWVTTRQVGGRADDAEQWAFRMTVVPIACTVWLLAVHARGLDVYSGNVLLGYVVACTALWVYLFTSGHVTSKVAKAQVRRAWSRSKLGKVLAGMDLVRRERTPLGESVEVDVTGAGLTASDLVGNAKAAEVVAAAHGLKAGRVVIGEGSTAGKVVMSVRRRSPWEVEIPHPNAPKFEHVPGRSVFDPIPVGLDPETGAVLTVQLAVRGVGGQHVKVFAGTRGGKTTFINSLVEYLTDCAEEVEVVMIDASKGKDARAWSPALHAAHFGPESASAATSELRSGAALIDRRAQINAERGMAVHVPTVEEKARVIIIDEADALLVNNERHIVEQARRAVEHIASKGASELVILVIAAQRAVLSSLGSSGVKANSFTTVVLPMLKTGEMNHALDDWRERGMPDMSKYGEGAKGVVLIAPGSEPWSSGRCFALYGLPTLNRIALSRPYGGDVGAALAVAQGAGQAVPDFDDDLVFEPPADGVDDEDVATEATEAGSASSASEQAVASGHPAGTDWPGQLTPANTWPPTNRRLRLVRGQGGPDAHDELAMTLDAAAAELAALGEDENRDRWAMRAEASKVADREVAVPADFSADVLRLANTRGPAGFTRAEVEQVVTLGKTATANHLRVMTNQGWLIREGAGRQVRYYLPSAAPGREQRAQG